MGEAQNGNGNSKAPAWLGWMSEFISKVGVPTAALAAFIAYFWFVGVKTNEHIAQGQKIMERAVTVIERLEKKLP